MLKENYRKTLLRQRPQWVEDCRGKFGWKADTRLSRGGSDF